MVIVAGHITVESQEREPHLAGVREHRRTGSRAVGCLDVAISADLVDPGRINIFERWASQAAVEAFRGSGPSDEQGAAIRSASVAEYEIAKVRPLFGDGTG
jgi:quinol monooxygenase YgiN